MENFIKRTSASLSLSLQEILPGALLVTLVAAAAFGMGRLPLFSTISPMMGAIIIGIAFGNIVGIPDNARAGILVCGKRVLRLAVALLGFQLTVWQVTDVGLGGVLAIAACLAATFAATVWLGKVMSVDSRLSLLIAAGTSVCGASAIATMNDVSKAQDEDVSYAIAAITLFGTLAMFLYPMLMSFLDFSPRAYGFWIGVSVHEVAQVVAAAFQGGQPAGETGVVVKLTRVMMLAPLIIVVGAVIRGRASATAPGALRHPIPLFVVGFIACMLVNSMIAIPDLVRLSIVSSTPILLTVSLAAIGLGTNLSRLGQRGIRPFLLAAISTLFIAVAGLLAVPLVV